MFRATLRKSIEGIALIVIVPATLYTPLGLIARRILSLRPMLYVGRQSYTLYLFHWLAKNLASYVAPSYSAEWFAIFIALTLAATLFCYHFVEMPIVAVRRRFGSLRAGTGDPACRAGFRLGCGLRIDRQPRRQRRAGGDNTHPDQAGGRLFFVKRG